MIFVTIGSLFPFDRLVRGMDEVAARMPQETFFAQIGDGTYEPQRMPHVRLMPRREFVEKVLASRLIVAHAGMGSVLSAMELGRPIVLLPRRHDLGEHNTDHQMATARWLQSREGVHVCFDDERLGEVVQDALASGGPRTGMPAVAPEPFLARIRDYIAST